MKGVGGYPHDWPYYASPASNLSAFAAPFSVNPYTSADASISPQFMDSAESAETVPPIHFHSYGYEFLSSPARELDSSAQFPLGLPSYSARSSRVEAQPYYVSPAIHDNSSSVAPYHWSSGAPSLDWPSLGDANKSPELGFSGQSAVSWDQFPEFNSRGKGKQVGVGSSLSSKETNAGGLVLEERMNQYQGKQGAKDSVNIEVSHIVDWENYNVPASANHLHDTSRWWGTVKPMPVEFSGAPVMQPPSMSLETHHEAPLKVVADSGNNHSSNVGSYDKYSKHDDKSSGFNTVSSLPRTGLITDFNIDDIIADEHVEHNNFYNTRGVSHTPSSGIADCFDSGPIHMHLGINELSSSNKATISDKNVSRDTVDHIFGGMHGEIHGFQNAHTNMDNLSLRLGAIEDVVEKSFEGGDRCNPAEDSPCWKGASTGHFCHFELSAALPREYVHKKESSFDSVFQESHNNLLDTENNIKKSGEHSNGNQMHTKIVHQETSSADSPRKFLVSINSAVNDGPFQSKPSCDFGLHFLDVIKIKENIVSPVKSTNCESGSSHMEHQIVDKNKLMSEKQQTPCIGDADAGCNVNNCLEYSSSHTAEHVLPSRPSVVDATTTPENSARKRPLVADTTTVPENSAGKVSTEKLNVHVLVDTMQNLSELLLYHCLNDTCELKERDCIVLKNVMSNLNTCALKNAEQTAPAKECLFNQPDTSNCVGESPELHQNVSFKRPQLTKIGPESSKTEFENPLVAEANLHFRSGKSHRKLSDSIFPRDDTEMTKDDNITKDLKRILSKNFHDDDDKGAEPQTVLYKNLWLEAEAALCSVYYKARYNQIKIEMDKHSNKEKEMEKQSKSEVVPTLSRSQSSATKEHSHPNPDSSALKLPVLDATNLVELSNATPEGKGGLDSFFDNHLVSCSDDEAERNDESSVMARYQILRARVDQSSIDTTNLEEPLDIADKSSPRGMDNQNQVNFCQGSPIPEKNSTDHETSVLARFHILKSRVEGSPSISSEGKPLDGVGSAGKGMDDTTIAKSVSEGKSLDVHVNPAVNPNSYTVVDKSTPKELHLDLEDKHGIKRETSEFQLSTYSDFSSDWEHVEKSL